jgi:hypothetical protein
MSRTRNLAQTDLNEAAGAADVDVYRVAFLSYLFSA